jgi:DNA polymerase-3 subunit delta'
MLLQDIPGREDIKAYLHKIVAEDRVPHAILLSGGEGYGKLQIALGFSALLQCQDRQPTGACGVCGSCSKTLQLIHPDLHLAFPVVKKDKLKREDTTAKDFMAEFRSFVVEHPYGDLNDWLTHLNASDKQANINKTECSKILKNLGLKTYEGRYKIQIIWYADYLEKEGNRLLKLIEEPSDDTIIIMITNNSTRVLNTLRSRCQIISIPPTEDAAMLEFIAESYSLSEEDRQELAFLSSGNLRKAQLLGQRQELNYSEELLNWLRLAYKVNAQQMVAFTNDMAGRGKQEIVNFLEYGLHYFREYLLYLNTGEPDKLRLTSTEKKVAMEMTKIIDHSKTEQIRDLFELSIKQIKRNVALKALLMTRTLQINSILR